MFIYTCQGIPIAVEHIRYIRLHRYSNGKWCTVTSLGYGCEIRTEFDTEQEAVAERDRLTDLATKYYQARKARPIIISCAGDAIFVDQIQAIYTQRERNNAGAIRWYVLITCIGWKIAYKFDTKEQAEAERERLIGLLPGHVERPSTTSDSVEKEVWANDQRNRFDDILF